MAARPGGSDRVFPLSRWYGKCSLVGYCMARQQLDALISAMVQSAEGISDLLFIVGRPPQVEVYGKLRAVETESLSPILTPEQTEQIAVTILSGSERLYADFMNAGSCDTSY